jgi:hypothetical protein
MYVCMVTLHKHTHTHKHHSGTSVGTSLAVKIKQDPLVFAFTDFTFWASPQMTLAAFEQSGLAITVDFSMDTDRAGMAISSTDCSAIFASTSALQSFGTFGTVSTRPLYLSGMVFVHGSKVCSNILPRFLGRRQISSGSVVGLPTQSLSSAWA